MNPMPEVIQMHETVAEDGIAMQPLAERAQTQTKEPLEAGSAADAKPWLARWQPRRLKRLAREKLSPTSWMRRWVFRDPPDPRTALRQNLCALDAYFFTGGKPEPHPVRDISATGVYVLTDVRWYEGTVVRVTLADRRVPTEDRSFTVQARVVRSDADGVGFQFELGPGDVARQRTLSDDLLGASVPKTRAELFIERVQSPAGD